MEELGYFITCERLRAARIPQNSIFPVKIGEAERARLLLNSKRSKRLEAKFQSEGVGRVTALH